jgi:hypothetical protein
MYVLGVIIMYVFYDFALIIVSIWRTLSTDAHAQKNACRNQVNPALLQTSVPLLYYYMIKHNIYICVVI